MAANRRQVLGGLAAAGAATVIAPSGATASARPAAPADAIGMLYDATRCIGCKACVAACREANALPYESERPLWDDPIDLSSNTKNIIKLYREGDRFSYVKAQCMQCIDPSCAGACMMGSLQKRDRGVVTWIPARCIGCRYCQVACPFNVPKFQFERANPRIVKCEMCKDRDSKPFQPACCEVCPRQAVVFGSYRDLLADARARLAADPARYYPKVYGETDGGGTQVLYLSAAGIPFEKLGLPTLEAYSHAEVPRTVQHGLYRGMALPAMLYAALGIVILRNRRKGAGKEEQP